MKSAVLGIGLIAFLALTLTISIAFAADNEYPYDKTYLENFLKKNGCNCTHYYMEQAARLIDGQNLTLDQIK